MPGFHGSRREFLATSAWGVAAACLPQTARGETSPPLGFCLVSDTHFLADKEHPDRLDERSAQVCGRLVDTLNALPGERLPEALGGGVVQPFKGVLHGGDVIDTGDKTGRVQEAMQRTEWDGFQREYGLTGSDGRLKYPVYEVHGNHDGPGGTGIVIDGIKARNRRRPGVTHISESGLHYAWEWGPVRFLNLGIVVGRNEAEGQRRRYQPQGSLEFLQADLQAFVKDRTQPLVLLHHIDVQRYSVESAADDPKNLGREWHPRDARAYYEALRGYNVVAIFYGHTHARNVLRWDGTSQRTEQGLPLFNVDNSSHFHGTQQAFFYCELSNRELTIHECQTTDGWATHQWTPQSWRRPLMPV